MPHTALELHAASLQQDGHQVRGEPAVDGSVGILRVRVRAGRAGAGGDYFPELSRVKETKI